MTLLPIFSLMRPSCGTRRSAMFSCAMILKREMSAALSFERRLHDFLQRAVDAVAHAELVLEALEVNVRRAALHGVGEDGVDQLDDRRVVDCGRERRR